MPLAVRAMLGTRRVSPHGPTEGTQLPPCGLGTSNPDTHQVGPLNPELDGTPLASARPHDATRNTFGRLSVALPNNANRDVAPKRAAWAESSAVAPPREARRSTPSPWRSNRFSRSPYHPRPPVG